MYAIKATGTYPGTALTAMNGDSLSTTLRPACTDTLRRLTV